MSIVLKPNGAGSIVVDMSGPSPLADQGSWASELVSFDFARICKRDEAPAKSATMWQKSNLQGGWEGDLVRMFI